MYDFLESDKKMTATLHSLKSISARLIMRKINVFLQFFSY